MIPGALQGSISAFLFESGLYKTADSQKASLEKVSLEFGSTLNNLRVEYQTLTTSSGNLQKTITGMLTMFNQQLESFKKQTNDDLSNSSVELKNKLTSLTESAQSDWIKLKSTYDAELAVRAPVVYWKSKTQSHLILSWIFAVLSVLVGIGIFICIYLETLSLIVPPKGLEHPELWHPEYWRLGLLVSTGLFGVWIVRIIVCLFLSNFHLQTDAKERVVMIQTYLALIRKGKLSTENEHYILTTLFRPSSTGIMKDDGVPLTALEAMSKLSKPE